MWLWMCALQSIQYYNQSNSHKFIIQHCWPIFIYTFKSFCYLIIHRKTIGWINFKNLFKARKMVRHQFNVFQFSFNFTIREGNNVKEKYLLNVSECHCFIRYATQTNLKGNYHRLFARIIFCIEIHSVYSNGENWFVNWSYELN